MYHSALYAYFVLFIYKNSKISILHLQIKIYD